MAKPMAFMLAGVGTPTLEIDIYSDIGEGGPVGPMGLFGWCDAVSANDILQTLRRADASTQQIFVRLNSEGGDVFEAFAIYSLLVQHPAHVTCQVDGLAASAGSLIAMSGDKIVMVPGSWMMIHNAGGGKRGGAQDLRDWADVLDKISADAAAVYAKRTKQPLADVQKMMGDETWMSASEALKLGFCDEIAPMKAKSAATDGAAKMTSGSAFATMHVGDYANVPVEVRALVESSRAARTAALKPVPFRAYETDAESAWDGPAAEMSLRKWASSDGSGDKSTIDWTKYRQGFAWYDDANPEHFGAYKLPHHKVVDGKLETVKSGVIAAGNVMSGSRGGASIPDADIAGVKKHLAKHYAEFGVKAPWESDSVASSSARPFQKLTSQHHAARSPFGELARGAQRARIGDL